MMMVTPSLKLEAMEVTPETRAILENEWGFNFDSTMEDGRVIVRNPESNMIVANLSPEVFVASYDILEENIEV